MIAQLTDGYSSRASKLQKLILRHNVWFSKLALSPGKFDGDAHEAREAFRQTVTAAFDCDRRSPRLASTLYYSDRVAYLQDGSPLQVNRVDFSSYTGMMMEDFAALLSALVVNQTAKRFSLRAEKRAITSDEQWKWLAYGLFSKRARAYSATEAVALNQVDALSDMDMEAFVAVLSSDHPEEVICGTPAGVVEDRNATLKSGSAIRWCFSRGQPVVSEKRKEIKVDSAVRCVRTFSDDGEREWVWAMIPGLGGCQVQRDALIFDLSSAIETRPGALKTLTIGFNREEHTSPRTDGLPSLLAAVGSTLKDLTIDGPRGDIDENVIIRHCPNLHTLSLCGGVVDVQLDLTDYRYANQPVPELTCHWHDVQALAADLSDANNPLSKIVRRLRLRLNDRCKGWRRLPGGYYFDKLPDDTKALVRMLMVNRHLEYLDVLMLSGHHKYGSALKKQHRKPIDRPARLSREVKLAFLSVASARLAPAVPARNKRPRQAVRSESVVGNGLDQRVASQIFSFAGPPLLRRVYFRTTKHYWERDWSDDFYNDEDEDDWDSEEGADDA